jgi:hypothetical protein
LRETEREREREADEERMHIHITYITVHCYLHSILLLMIIVNLLLNGKIYAYISRFQTFIWSPRLYPMAWKAHCIPPCDLFILQGQNKTSRESGHRGMVCQLGLVNKDQLYEERDSQP